MTASRFRSLASLGLTGTAVLLAVAACDRGGAAASRGNAASQSPSRDETDAQLDALRRRNDSLEREVKDLRKSLAAANTEAAPTPSAPPPPIPTALQSSNPWTLAKPWVDDAVQVQDAGKRDAAIEAIRHALSDQVPEQVAAALCALPQIGQVRYDKMAMRELVLRHATSPDASVRAAFPFALLNVGGPQPGDVDLVLPLASDGTSTVRSNAGRSLAFFTKGDLTGKAGDCVLALLDDPDRQVRRDVLGSVWGSQVSPKIEARLLSDFASPDQETKRQAFYFGLSTLKPKSPAVVDACIAAMESSDRDLQWRARWGLAQGVPDDQRGKVGDAYLRLLNARTDPQLERDAFEWLRRDGTIANAAGLDKLAELPLLSEATRKAVKETASAIRARVIR